MQVASNDLADSQAVEINLEGVKSLAATMAKSVSVGADVHLASIAAKN